ncbi:uncharacterized protein LOC121733634 [Aricia agestis]|uniref:uncharacterized protein LOC121733634 n=1 Tax=Aricia agestis TaxID=91739 RepID=UPI001C2063B6|nr:uncharacterized protein LOC121733634 [Aricia agestis]
MLVACARFLLGTFLVLFCAWNSCGQFVSLRNAETTMKPLPFPTCKADDLECLRRGLRTFFFLMNSGYLGMKQIDPMELNSISISLPEERMGFLLRRVNVSGALWTKLVDRSFDTERNSVRFFSDLHVMGDLSVNRAERDEPYVARLTMDIGDVESNITYAWTAERGIDEQAYILIGRDRIVVRNSRTPTFFLEPESADSIAIREAISNKPAILEHISNEITLCIMQTIVENFRYFAKLVPVKEFYQLNLM